MNALKRNKMNIGVIIITLIITATIVYLDVYRFYGYKVSIGSSTITFVKNKKEFNKTYKELQSEIKSKYGNVITIKDLTLDKVKVNDDDMFISGDSLKKVMLKKFNIVVDVFLMKSDNRKMAYVINENQGKEILNSVKDYYSEDSKLNSIRKIDIENNISYEPVKVKTGNLYENHEIIKEVIKYNNKAQVPLITVKTVGNTIKEQAIYPTTIIKSSSKLINGIKKVEHEGIDGKKEVTTEVIAINNNIISEKVLKEDTITPVQNKEILVGTNNPITPKLASINSPSRGSISSSFGERWGKMHKGVDIAASFGATISAALDEIGRAHV